MQLLVVGANGLLGSNLVQAGKHRDWTVAGTYHSTRPKFEIPLTQFDLENHATFGNVLDEHTPEVVVNCAAMTDVDQCERELGRAQTLNGDAPGEIAAQCAGRGIEFVHISTDYVFDGSDERPYTETSEPEPIQAYGDSKLAGERAVRETTESVLIARLSFVWGIHRSHGTLEGFPAWVEDQIQAGETVPLFTDQRMTPTRAGQAATVLIDMIERDVAGTYHVASRSCVSPYEFGTEIAEYTGCSDLIEENSMADVERAASRPKNTCLDVGKLESTLGRPQPTLREDVARVWNER
ncbi:dTDP-4-dehydrorhamnose reductase [Halosimplex halobium]|uniref:dTDP-4-dehydrorhamnose reductase n=1 Tax=Halosimplex halobium TaxID=3396618 RepID=UPI003F55124D